MPECVQGPPLARGRAAGGDAECTCSEGHVLGGRPSPELSQKLLDFRGLWGSFQNIPKCLMEGPPTPSRLTFQSLGPGLVSLCSCSLGHLCPSSWQPGTEAKRSSAQSGTGRPASGVSLLGEEGAERGGTAGSLDQRVWSALQKKLMRAGDELCEEGPQGEDAGTRLAQSHCLLHGGRGWAAAPRAVRGESWGGWSLRTSG